jgi:hypothetical protein
LSDALFQPPSARISLAHIRGRKGGPAGCKANARAREFGAHFRDCPDRISDSILVARQYILGTTGCADNPRPHNLPKDKTVLLDVEAFLAAASTIPRCRPDSLALPADLTGVPAIIVAAGD